MRVWPDIAISTLLTLVIATCAAAGDANRMVYLDGRCDPYYPDQATPRLITPQWIDVEGVEAVVVLNIADLSDVPKYEAFLRPIIDRLKKIDGRGPVSIMANRIDPADKHLQRWLAEGVGLETHTRDHPCPCLHSGKTVAWSKGTYDAAIDMMARIPGNRPVAFRMPCGDSMNAVSPRFFAEIFNKKTPSDNFLSVDSSVFTAFTAADPSLPRSLVLDENGEARFQRYLPKDLIFGWVENYPYPYVIGRLCWEVPAATPNDWQGQNLRGNGSLTTLADMKATVDATVLKQGVYSLVFHPNDWLGGKQLLELIDYAVAKYGNRVKFVTLGEMNRLLTENALGGQPLRAADGTDGGVRVLDLNGDGFMDVVVGNENVRQTRVWSPETGKWIVSDFPVAIVSKGDQGNRDAGVRFGVLQKSGNASFVVRNDQAAGVWHFDGSKWVEQRGGMKGLELNGPVCTSRDGRDAGVRLLDLDRDGACELIVGNDRQNGVFSWSSTAGRWSRLPFGLPTGTVVVDAKGRDAGLRFVDPDVDGHPDVVFSNGERYSVHLFTSVGEGWSQEMLAGRRGERPENDKHCIPPIVRADGTDNGAWFKFNHLWVQNEQTGGRLPGHVDRRHVTDLLGTNHEPPER